MPSRPTEAHSRKDNRQKQARSTNNSSRQHGNPHLVPRPASSSIADLLLRIPAESLTHVTSFLDPPDLHALAQTCKPLNAHVTDDNTWRRAYAYQYFGIAPESDLSDDAVLMLRKEESSWRGEFTVRYKLRRQWEYSPYPSITHVPLHSAVTVMHLMPHTTLLAASLQYGVVSRSYPLTGKVLRGFLDASGTMNGLGVGNPNAEFSPHVSAIALTSDGGTAKILWGYRNGEVAATLASRATDRDRRPSARLVRCRPADGHDGVVNCVAWVSGCDGRALFVSGGSDGRVRLWEAVTTTLTCLWSSTSGLSLVADPCVKVTMDPQQGIIAAALGSGVVVVWVGFPPESQSTSAFTPRQIRIPAPVVPVTSEPALDETTPQLEDLRIAPYTGRTSLLVAYQPSTCFYRYWLDTGSSSSEVAEFGDPARLPLRTVYPVWASHQGERSFVIAGDQVGNVTIYPWGASKTQDGRGVSPVHRIAAHEDGAITALGWNSVVLVTGSSRGTTKVWDALTFAPLRAFPSPNPRSVVGEWEAVGQILLERDAIVVSVGNRVLAWKAGPAGRSGHGKGKGIRTVSGRSHNGTAYHNGMAKWQQQIEMYRDIAESRRELEEEQIRTRRAIGREQEQLSSLQHLGLSEAEVVEYLLMVSRDEEEARLRKHEETTHYSEDEGVFMADFDDLSTPMVTPTSTSSSKASSVASSTSSSSGHSSPELPYLRGAPQGAARQASSSSPEFQVLPRVLPESMRAGSSTSPMLSRSVSSTADVPPSLSDTHHFPAVAVSRASSSTSAASGSSDRNSVCSSPQSVRSVWNTPLRPVFSSEAPPRSSVVVGVPVPSPQIPMPALSGILTSTSRVTNAALDEDDEDIKFAIELSLAEARSRGENV